MNYVWESMYRVNVKFMIRIWSVLIEGCSRVWFKGVLDKMWENLIMVGVKLDMYIWMFCVVGLFKFGDVEGGIRVLVDMERMWVSREKNLFVVVKLFIEFVNVVILGLFKVNR